MSLDWTLGALAEGLECYRNEEFFLAHEHWETVWLVSLEPERTFLQALIQITAAFHHFQQKNLLGTASLLNAALRRLEPFPQVFEGVFLVPLRESIHAWLDALDSREMPIHLPFPEMVETRLGQN